MVFKLEAVCCFCWGGLRSLRRVFLFFCGGGGWRPRVLSKLAEFPPPRPGHVHENSSFGLAILVLGAPCLMLKHDTSHGSRKPLGAGYLHALNPSKSKSRWLETCVTAPRLQSDAPFRNRENRKTLKATPRACAYMPQWQWKLHALCELISPFRA